MSVDVQCVTVDPRMDDHDAPDEALADIKGRQIGGWGVAQIAVGTGLTVYAMWVGILQPGFRKVPLKLQVCSRSTVLIIIIKLWGKRRLV